MASRFVTSLSIARGDDEPSCLVPRTRSASAALQLWGGIECTVARLGDTYRDQVAETGHRERHEDLDLIAALGIRRLRYPALWETISPTGADACDWSWHDARFAKLQALDITPIVGLMHHGSGPRATNLLDPAMPALLATHAARVAERTPFVQHYTPINEPLTTARFSGLYGHWYPHLRTETAFLRMLVNQCKAILLAMRAIRRLRPDARLVQTEDVGQIFGTPHLAAQVAYENERRWLSLDLLHGRVVRGHPWRARLVDHGVPDDDLALLEEGDGMPDVIGVNYYVTSDRFLDEHLARYSPATYGGNGRAAYADVEAVRIAACAEMVGIDHRLREVWRRYGRPIAVTETHLGGSADEQLRWLAETWNAAVQLREEGVDIGAVTIWSMFGAVDWDTLLVQRASSYEPGVFDARVFPPLATPLAHAVKSLATTGAFQNEALRNEGWWRRDDRFF